MCVCTRAYIEPNAAETANARARLRARVIYASRLHDYTCHISQNTTHWRRTNARFHVSSRGVPNSYAPVRTQWPVSLPDHPRPTPGGGVGAGTPPAASQSCPETPPHPARHSQNSLCICPKSYSTAFMQNARNGHDDIYAKRLLCKIRTILLKSSLHLCKIIASLRPPSRLHFRVLLIAVRFFRR